jgi:hypothetical protein
MQLSVHFPSLTSPFDRCGHCPESLRLFQKRVREEGFGYQVPASFTLPKLPSGIYLIENTLPFCKTQGYCKTKAMLCAWSFTDRTEQMPTTKAAAKAYTQLTEQSQSHFIARSDGHKSI